MAYRGELRYMMAGQSGSNLGAATVQQSSILDQKLEVGYRYRIDFLAKGVAGGGVPWTPRFQREIEAGLAQKGVTAKVVKVTPGTFTPTSGSATLDWVTDWVPGAGVILPSRDLYGNFTFSIDIEITGKGTPPAYMQPEDYGVGMQGVGAIPVVAYYIGIGVVAGIVALSVLATSVVVTAMKNLGKAIGQGVAGLVWGIGDGITKGGSKTLLGAAVIAGGVFLWMKYSNKGRAMKSKVFG